MDSVEVRANLDQTTEFIKADSSWITFMRRVPQVRDAAGGRKPGGPPKAIKPQQVRILPPRSRTTRLGSFTSQGEVLQRLNSILMGLPTLDVVKNDEFTWRAETYKVLFIQPDRTFGTLAEIELLGPTDRQTL